jgi:DinB family protein
VRYVAAKILTLLFVPVLPAQTSQPSTAVTNPVVATVRQMETRFAKNLVGAADEMPADKYSYRPTPEQITFGHLIMHSTEANNSLCAAVAGEKPHEMKLSETDSKETLTKALKESFSYCEQVLAKADDTGLGQTVTLYENQTGTRASALVRMAAGWSDHYSAAAMYLRLNNLVPPSAQKH